MPVNKDRELIIRTAWEERGKAQWKPETHGRGLLPLNIPAKVEMRPVRFGSPLPAYDNLEFKLTPIVTNGQQANAIVCEGVVVETIQSQPSSIAISANVRTGLQGVTFADGEAAKKWLSRQRTAVAAAFIARAALRVVPVMDFSTRPSGRRSLVSETVLRVFHAVSAAWAIAAYPGHRRALRKVARTAGYGLGNVQLPPPVRAAAYALLVAITPSKLQSRNVAINYVIDAAASRGADALNTMLHALAIDAQVLEQRVDPVALVLSRLWPSPTPNWIEQDWAEMKQALLDADEDWDVWTTWYDARLSGLLADQDMEIARQKLDEDIWKGRPRLVNSHIKDAITERQIFQSATADQEQEEEEELPDATSIPQQVTTASQFAINAGGRIDLVRNAPQSDGLQREIYQELRYKALGLSEIGHNQLADLAKPVGRFLAASPEHIEDVEITIFWSRGNTLRRHLRAHEIAVASAEPYDPSRLTPKAGEMLRDLVDTFNIFVVGDLKGRELDLVRLGPQERSAASFAISIAVPIVQAVLVSANVATTNCSSFNASYVCADY